MATARATLAAEHRDMTGKKVARLRRAGRLPAVVYGHGVDSDSVSIDAHEFEQLRRHTGPNALVDLSVDGKQGAARSSSTASRSTRSTAGPLHVDLFLVRMTEELTVDVPLVATGESPAVAAQGGTLLHPIESRPGPGAARSPAAVDRVLGRRRWSTSTRPSTFATWSIPGDVTLLTDGDEIIAKVQAPRVEEVVEVPAEVGEGGAEGEAAEGEPPVGEARAASSTEG